MKQTPTPEILDILLSKQPQSVIDSMNPQKPVESLVGSQNTPKASNTPQASQNGDSEKQADLRASIIELNSTISNGMTESAARKAAGLLLRIYTIDLPIGQKINAIHKHLSPEAQSIIAKAIRFYQNGNKKAAGGKSIGAKNNASHIGNIFLKATNVHVYSPHHSKGIKTLAGLHHRISEHIKNYRNGKIAAQDLEKNMRSDREQRNQELTQRLQTFRKDFPNLDAENKQQAIQDLQGLRRFLAAMRKERMELMQNAPDGKSRSVYLAQLQADIAGISQFEAQIATTMADFGIPCEPIELSTVASVSQESATQQQTALNEENAELTGQPSTLKKMLANAGMPWVSENPIVYQPENTYTA